MDTFARNIRKCLRAYGWTANDLVVATGMHQPNISRILNCKEGVTLTRAAKIAAALEVDLSDLLSENFEIDAITA